MGLWVLCNAKLTYLPFLNCFFSPVLPFKCAADQKMQHPPASSF
jgi:hypothetical protein